MGKKFLQDIQNGSALQFHKTQNSPGKISRQKTELHIQQRKIF